MDDMMKIMSEMNKKMDMMMEHLGCKMSKEDYMSMPDDKKDEYDEESVKEETKEEAVK